MKEKNCQALHCMLPARLWWKAVIVASPFVQVEIKLDNEIFIVHITRNHLRFGTYSHLYTQPTRFRQPNEWAHNLIIPQYLYQMMSEGVGIDFSEKRWTLKEHLNVHVHMNTLDSFQLAAEKSPFPSSDLEGFRTLSLELWDFENEEIEPCW